MTTVLEALNSGLYQALSQDPAVYLLGEDILDPYGGAFKVTRGLSSAFPGRVLATPISEAGIVGAAAGMALRGLRPVLEIMFGDFLTLACDQLINHAAKFCWMYHQQVNVPLLVRTPMGGRRGYGPTHSQTLEKHFLGVPGLNVLAPTHLGRPDHLLQRAILESNQPTLFIENKLLYLQPLLVSGDSGPLADFCLESQAAQDPAPVYRLRLKDAPAPMLTLAAYGYMAELARQAALQLAYEQEIFVELVVFTRLAPVDLEVLLEALQHTGQLLTVEEGGLTLGWGAEVVARASEALGPRLQRSRRLAAADLPIPASGPLEARVLPGVADIVQAARALVR